jgi:hypothetical protein
MVRTRGYLQKIYSLQSIIIIFMVQAWWAYSVSIRNCFFSVFRTLIILYRPA